MYIITTIISMIFSVAKAVRYLLHSTTGVSYKHLYLEYSKVQENANNQNTISFPRSYPAKKEHGFPALSVVESAKNNKITIW